MNCHGMLDLLLCLNFVVLSIAKESTGVKAPSFDLSSDMLPDSLPEGDPANFALPVFLEEPVSTYAAKGHQGTLRCRAAHANKLFFTCDNEPMKSTTESHGNDPKHNNVAYMEITVNIKRDQVLDTLEDFSCRCHAASNQGEVESQAATVDIAYLRKDFVTPPYSTHIEVGSQAELRCHPPNGNPKAEVVSWLRNGVPIRPGSGGDSNFIISSTGHLLILQARLVDSANYSCVAANVARQRTSDPALVTIYIPGSWGAWSEWSGCNVECGRGLQERKRTCNNPAPVNGGPGCDGPAVKKKSCTRVCPGVHGGWSSWSSWSSCSTDCLQYRRRTCSSPTPSNGGRYCQGRDVTSSSCTGGTCRPELLQDATSKNLPVVVYGGTGEKDRNNGVATSDLTLYIGLAVAFLVFVLVVFVIVRLLQRKRDHSHTGYSLTPAGYSTGSNSSQAKKPGLGYTPDLTQGAPGHSVCYEYTYSDNNSNTSLKGSKAGFLQPMSLATQQLTEVRPISEHFYEQPMRVFQTSSSPAASLGRGSTSEGSSSSPGPVPASLGLPRCADQQQSSWTRVGEAGARVTVPRSSVSLTVPQGAIEPGRTEEVWVCVVSAGNQLRPSLEPGQNLITSVVVVGPLHLTAHLKKPVVVSIPHCGGPGVSQVKVLQCDRLEPGTTWRCVAVSGQEDAQSSTSVYVDSSMCQLVTERLAAFALVSCDQTTRGSITTTSSGCSSLGSGPPVPPSDSEPSFRIPLSVKQSLSLILDPPAPHSNDWRQLAERLGVNRYVNFFSTQASPTEAILNLWEARNRESTAVAGLVNTLRGMGRHDAAQVLDMDTSWP